jgi:hypothetical protein
MSGPRALRAWLPSLEASNLRCGSPIEIDAMAAMDVVGSTGSNAV